MNLLGQRRQQRVFQDRPLAFLQQDALVLDILRDLAREGSGGCPAGIGGDINDKRRIPGQVRLIAILACLERARARLGSRR